MREFAYPDRTADRRAGLDRQASAPRRVGRARPSPSPEASPLRSPRPRFYKALGLAIASAAAVAIVQRAMRARPRAGSEASEPKPELKLATRRLKQGAALLATSVLADSTLSHYRADFQNPAMYTPPIMSAATLTAIIGSVSDPRVMLWRDGIYAAAAVTGIVGTGFHLYNIAKRPGGAGWLNVFYAAPVGAPAAITAAGLLGLAADRLSSEARAQETLRLLRLPAAGMLIATTAIGLLATVMEVWVLHFRGAFHNPFMFVPVSLPPLASCALALAGLRPGRTARGGAAALLRATAAMGFAGVGFHAYGIHRNMGGFRNWTQTILSGPPLPAPPSFTGMALAGLGALKVLELAHG
jgi:hypothetical protein